MHAIITTGGWGPTCLNSLFRPSVGNFFDGYPLEVRLAASTGFGSCHPPQNGMRDSDSGTLPCNAIATYHILSPFEGTEIKIGGTNSVNESGRGRTFESRHPPSKALTASVRCVPKPFSNWETSGENYQARRDPLFSSVPGSVFTECIMASIGHFRSYRQCCHNATWSIRIFPIPSWNQTVSNRFLRRSPGDPGLILLLIEVRRL
jgi:hypothetical protein